MAELINALEGVAHKLKNNFGLAKSQQIYHWQIWPITFEFSSWSHVPNECPAETC